MNKLLTRSLGCARRNSGQLYRELMMVSPASLLLIDWGLTPFSDVKAYGDLNLIVSGIFAQEKAMY